MKTCRGCAETKPLDGFYRHPQMGDGYLNFCKLCVIARVKKYTDDHHGEVLEKYRARYYAKDMTEQQKLARREAGRRHLERNKDKARQWSASNPKKRKAHIIVGNAIRDGLLIPKPCERCSYGIGVQAHHEDYSKPLDVTWLCRPCHGMRHREINEDRRHRAA